MYMYMYMYMYICIYMYMYVGDGFITRPVLKLSDGFKAGLTASHPARRLDIQPDSFEAGLTTC